MGLSSEILDEAVANLSEGGRQFENILRTAEQSRIEAEEAKRQAEQLKTEWSTKLSEVNAEREKLKKEREKLFLSAKMESRRIVNERTEQAEELLAQIEEIAKRRDLTEADLIRARTLKNKLADKAYLAQTEEEERPSSAPLDFASLKKGDRVFVGAMQSSGEVLSVNPKKQEAEVLVGSIRLNVKGKDLFRMIEPVKRKVKRPIANVQVNRKIEPIQNVKTEINLIGLTVSEAVQEVDALSTRPFLPDWMK